MSQVASVASGGGSNMGPSGRLIGKPMRTQGGEGNVPFSKMTFDGKRMRKAIQRRTVDYNHSLTRWIEERLWIRDRRDTRFLRPDPNFIVELMPPVAYLDNPINAVTTKFIHTSTNKIRYPVNVVRWTPEGRRLITGSSSGEFTLWNGLTFNFETILQAHDSPVRAMNWSHNDHWMVTGDHSGIIKYWQSNMSNLKMFTGHKEAIRDLTQVFNNSHICFIRFAPTDTRFATCSDDSLIKIWDFNTSIEERTLSGHGWDVKCVDWHPYKALLASGSKDNLIKLWDPKTAKNITTLHGHKNTVLALEWNQNGNWLVSAGRDQLVRVYDIRAMKELQVFRGHKREVCSARWHPHHERLLATGGSDGALMFWLVGQDGPVGEQENAHDSNIWSLDWHPVGHILVSGANDHTTRFWTRPRPGESVDKFDASQHTSEESSRDEESVRSFEPPPFRPNNAAPPTKIEPPPFRPINIPRSGPSSSSSSNNNNNNEPPLFRPPMPPPPFRAAGGPPPPPIGNPAHGPMHLQQPGPPPFRSMAPPPDGFRPMRRPDNMRDPQQQQQQQQHFRPPPFRAGGHSGAPPAFRPQTGPPPVPPPFRRQGGGGGPMHQHQQHQNQQHQGGGKQYYQPYSNQNRGPRRQDNNQRHRRPNH
ncbi:WD40-repeat-containing domain protein [Dichotomocladium elegans]|nr:WD40-repeat-containing domain protein [Dichotomocladium elegans]